MTPTRNRASGRTGLLLASLAAIGTASGCSSAGDDDGASAGDAFTSASECTDQAPTACTPAPGSSLRSFVGDVLRHAIREDLAKNGALPKDADVKFVFKTMVTERGQVYVTATIKRADGVTDFDFRGTKYEGDPSFVDSIQALLEVESGTEFAHRIGLGLDPKKMACEWVLEPSFPRDLYPGGDPAKDCSAGGDGPPADPKASCAAGEQTLFSCATVDRQNVALCASSDLSNASGYLQLRFGTASGARAVPDDAHRSQFRSDAKAQTVVFAGGSGEYVELDEQDRYVVYTSSDRDSDAAGLVVLRDGNVVEQHRCDGPPTSKLAPELYAVAGLPEGPGSFDFDP